MKKIVLVLMCVAFAGAAFAGGIVTNTNHSAHYIRTMSRDASLDADAAYYNPAGLGFTEDGFCLQFNNQSIFQDREVDNDFVYLHDSAFKGSVSAPLFPNFYGVYKNGDFALSLAFAPIGGGGSADFPDGLPSFEVPIAVLVPALAPDSIAGVTDYSADIAFKGSSVYLGTQLGLTYEVNDKFSLYGGVRYVSAKNTYEGHLKDIQINPLVEVAPGDIQNVWMDASDFFNNLGAMYAAAADTFEVYGLTDSVTVYEAKAQAMYASAEKTSDTEVDAERTGSGYTPVIGFAVRPMDGLDIGFRFEFITKLEMENNTTKDDTGMFPDGAKVHADMPAMVALGVGYDVSDKFHTSLSFDYFMNTGVDWDGKEEDVDDGWQLGLGEEYQLNDALNLSVGYLRAVGGARQEYNSDMDYTLDSNTIGAGLGYSINQALYMDLGFSYTMYDDASNTLLGDPDSGIPDTQNTYKKSATDFAIGLRYMF